MGHDVKNHENHLCEIVKKGINENYINKVRGAKFICGICGRIATSEKSLCDPKPFK